MPKAIVLRAAFCPIDTGDYIKYVELPKGTIIELDESGWLCTFSSEDFMVFKYGDFIGNIRNSYIRVLPDSAMAEALYQD